MMRVTGGEGSRASLFASFAAALVLPSGAAFSQDETNYRFDTSLYDAMEWRSIGPYRGGRVTAVTGVPGKPHLFYFGGVGGGVWRTQNAGVTWENISDEYFETSSVGAIAVSRSDSNVIYVGMGEACVRGVTTSHGNGVYKSVDAGETWVHVGLEGTRQISAVRIHPDDPDVVYVAAQGSPWHPTGERGIYRSLDGGASWTKLLFVNETSGASGLSMDATNPRILYAAFWDHRRVPRQIRSGGPGSGLYKSGDGGDNWEKLEEGLPDEMGKIGVAVSPASPNRVWAMIEAADDVGGVYRSDDRGATWQRINSDRALRARAWYYTHIYADPVDGETVYVLAAPMMKSTDGGRTFSYIATPHIDNHGLWINPDNTKWMINSNDGGANVSFDGGKTWSTQNNQPTGQFYRVIADNRFPYYIYGGQQDNSTVAIASRSFSGGIGPDDWYPVGGGEAAHVALDLDDAGFVYATNLMGVITEYNRDTGKIRNLSSYPMLGIGTDVLDFRYRFNWNGPVVVSQHNPEIIYHAGNVLLKSTDRGQSWREISPDLTRNEADKHVKGGVPFTNAMGGDWIYNTIMYVAESPRNPDTIWVGSDDGLLHLTRDGGANWDNVTPRGVGEAQINAIDVSPHQAGVAYLAVTRYKFGDLRPMAFRTDDYGESWQHIDSGLPQDSFVRVVREDTRRAGLLYAGTETGVHVSFDNGRRWQPLKLNLPATPVTDLRVHRGDIIIATQGRGFWILDNPAPLRELNDDVADSAVYLYEPAMARLLDTTARGEGEGGGQGENPPNGAVLYFYLDEAPDVGQTPVTIRILDADGQLVRKLGTEKNENLECTVKNEEADIFRPQGDRKFDVAAGMNRVVWDLRRPRLTCIPGQFFPWGWQGPRVPPGDYTVRLSVGDVSTEQPLTIEADPRLGPRADYGDVAAWLETLYLSVNDLHAAVVTLRNVRKQIELVTTMTAGHRNARLIEGAAAVLIGKLNAVDDVLVQRRYETPQDVANYPNKLNAHLVHLMLTIDDNGPPVTGGMEERFADLMAEWRGHKSDIEGILGEGVTRFNALLQDNDVPPVYVPIDAM